MKKTVTVELSLTDADISLAMKEMDPLSLLYVTKNAATKAVAALSGCNDTSSLELAAALAAQHLESVARELRKLSVSGEEE